MLRFPFNSSPAPRQMHNNPRNIQSRPEDNKKLSYDDLINSASFSPELSFLLAMTLKDGLCKNTMLDMLKNIEPYVSAADKQAIHSILGARQLTENFKRSTPDLAPSHSCSKLSEFSKLSRQQALLNVLQKYASNETSAMMQSLQRSTQMQNNFEKMNRRMQRLRNMNSSNPEEMFEAMSMFMPQEEQSDFRNMQNMMRMKIGRAHV